MNHFGVTLILSAVLLLGDWDVYQFRNGEATSFMTL